MELLGACVFVMAGLYPNLVYWAWFLKAWLSLSEYR